MALLIAPSAHQRLLGWLHVAEYKVVGNLSTTSRFTIAETALLALALTGVIVVITDVHFDEQRSSALPWDSCPPRLRDEPARGAEARGYRPAGQVREALGRAAP